MATVCSALILICAVQIAEPPSAAEQAIIDLAASMPGFLEVVWQLAAALLGIWAATIVVAGLVQRRGALLVDVVMGMGLATALWWWIDGIVGELQGAGRVPVLLSIGAVAVGCARPHLGRPYQRIGRWLVITAAIAVVILGTTTPTGAVTAMLIAVTSAGLSHLVLGTREGRPDLGSSPRRSPPSGDRSRSSSSPRTSRRACTSSKGPAALGRSSRGSSAGTRATRSSWRRRGGPSGTARPRV